MTFQENHDLEKLQNSLYQIMKLLTCPLCERFLQNPIGLQCNHRCCERCALQRKDRGKATCSLCNKPIGSKSTFRNQAQLKMYITRLKKLIQFLKNNCDWPIVFNLFEYVNSRKKLYELVDFNKENDMQLDDELDAIFSQDELYFAPEHHSTIMQIESPFDNLNTQKKKVFGEIVISEKTGASCNTDNPDGNGLPVTEPVTTTIEKCIESQPDQMNNLNTVVDKIDSNALPMPNDLMCEQSSSNTDEQTTQTPTQSQYHVMKQSITYVHKELDKFDFVIQNTKPFAIESSSEETAVQCDEPKAKDMLMHLTTNSSNLSGSFSPELYLSDIDDSDDSLMGANLF